MPSRLPHHRLSTGLMAALAPLAVSATTPPVLAAQAPEPSFVEEMEELAGRPAVEAAFERIEDLDAWSLEMTVELTEIPAPPFMEDARAARFAELLREVGADSVWIDAEGNVFGLRRGRDGEGTVVLAGHLDTVFPEGTDVTVRQRGDTLYAPGIGDDTRGLVVVLTALRAMAETDLRTAADLLFVGVVGEEGLGDLRGMKHVFRPGGPEIDAWVEVDGGGLSQVVSMALGSKRYRPTFRGPGGHSWGAFGTANPAHALGRGIHIFQGVADTLTRSGPRTSYNVGRLGGGTSVNSIPFEAWAEVDMRSVSPARLDHMEGVFLASMRRALEEENRLRRSGPPLTVDLEKIGDRPSGELDPSTPLVQRALASARLFGEEGRLVRSSTDANIPISMGVPAVTIGRGGVGANAHSPDEWWMNRDGHLAIQRALLVVVAEAGLASEP